MAHRVAPVALAGAAADGLGLELVDAAGREVADDHARVAEQAGVLVGAGDAAGADERVAQAIDARIGHGRDHHDELAAAPVDNVGDGGRVQRALRAIGADGFEAAGQQLGQVVAVIVLHVAGEPAQESHQSVALVVLVRRIGGAARLGGGDPSGEVALGAGERVGVDGDGGIGWHGPKITGIEAVMDGLGGFLDDMIGAAGEAEADTELGHTFGFGLGLGFRNIAVPSQARVPAQRVALGVLPVPGGRCGRHGGWIEVRKG